MAADRHPDLNWLYRWSRRLFLVSYRLVFRLEIHGEENMPESGGVMVISNHASNLDPPVLGCMVRRRPLHSLAKEELFRIPIFGRWARGVNVHPIRRGGVDRKAMREAVSLMREGGALLVFPEGTRTHDGNVQPARSDSQTADSPCGRCVRIAAQ